MCVACVCLTAHWQQRTLRKQERPEQLGVGTDILFGRSSLSSHTQLSLALSLSVVPLPILLSVWHFDKVWKLSCCSAFRALVASEQTMCWHGDEEDEDSTEVKSCSRYLFLSCSKLWSILAMLERDFYLVTWGHTLNVRVSIFGFQRQGHKNSQRQKLDLSGLF